MTYYALFTFNRLCQTQHEGFLHAEECHIYMYIYMKVSISKLKYLLSISINIRAQLLQQTL